MAPTYLVPRGDSILGVEAAILVALRVLSLKRSTAVRIEVPFSVLS